MLNETFRRIRTLHSPCGSRYCSSTQRHKTAPGRASQTSCQESEPAWPKTETKSRQAFRFGPRSSRPRLIERRFFFHLAGDFSPRQTLPNDLADCQIKAVTVIHVLTDVIAESLLVQIAKQVKRLDTHISSVDTTLQKAPEILKPVGMNAPVDVFNGMVNDLVA